MFLIQETRCRVFWFPKLPSKTAQATGKYQFLLVLVEVILATPSTVNDLGLRLCLGPDGLGWPVSVLNFQHWNFQSPKEEVSGGLPGGNGHYSHLILKTPSAQALFGYSTVCKRMNSCQAQLSSPAQMFPAAWIWSCRHSLKVQWCSKVAHVLEMCFITFM